MHHANNASISNSIMFSSLRRPIILRLKSSDLGPNASSAGRTKPCIQPIGFQPEYHIGSWETLQEHESILKYRSRSKPFLLPGMSNIIKRQGWGEWKVINKSWECSLVIELLPCSEQLWILKTKIKGNGRTLISFLMTHLTLIQLFKSFKQSYLV